MADLGQAYVEIIPKAPGISNKISDLVNPGAERAGVQGGKSLADGMKSMLLKAGIGAAVVGTVKAALDEGGKLQQSFGGLETIYGDAADAAKSYAQEAAKAGISANDYAEQAVSFGASLKQAFGGDTTAAVEAANTAIMDMTDNAAKMGTPIENIQSAYQGFAKQNYTMLDNLKLGYGGTKSEMERLLADAEKISGVEYNIDNLGDVYDAIHVIQGDLGLTGVAAEEAANTFSGSFGAMKASLQNLLGALTTGEGVEEAMGTLLENVSNFVINNLGPMVIQIVKAIPPALKTAIPQLMSAVKDILKQLRDTIVQNGPEWLEKAKELLISMVQGFYEEGPNLMSSIGELLEGLAQYIMERAPEWAKAAGELIKEWARSFIENIPEMLKAAMKFQGGLLDFLASLAVTLVDIGAELIAGLVQGIYEAIAAKLSPAIDRIMTPIRNLKTKITTVFNSIKTTATSIWLGIKTAITHPIETAKTLIQNAIQTIKNIISGAKLELPHFKLPHFKISGGEIPWGIGGQGKKPTIDVEWYAKGGVFDVPSIIGVGEAGREAVVPLQGSYMRPFAEAIAREMSGGGNTFYITVDGAENPEEFADRLVRQIQLRARMA